MELVSSQIELETMFKHAIAAVEPLAAKNNTRLTLDLRGELGRMYSDPMRIRQILFNLLSNACKFTRGGSVTLHAECYESSQDKCLRVVVADSGIGMTEEQISRVFQPFYQAEAETASQFGGTGLGLAIVQRICKQMGGRISIESAAGKGTGVTVDLPFARPTFSVNQSAD